MRIFCRDRAGIWVCIHWHIRIRRHVRALVCVVDWVGVRLISMPNISLTISIRDRDALRIGLVLGSRMIGGIRLLRVLCRVLVLDWLWRVGLLRLWVVWLWRELFLRIEEG